MKNNEEHICLNMYTLRSIRRYVLKQTKKSVAACCGINQHTYSRIESVKTGRKTTIEKILNYFFNQLRTLGWNNAKVGELRGLPCIIMTH